MKSTTGKAKVRANGTLPTRRALLAAHERALKRLKKMTAREGFESLVRAGIYTRDGKLAARYGG